MSQKALKATLLHVILYDWESLFYEIHTLVSHNVDTHALNDNILFFHTYGAETSVSLLLLASKSKNNTKSRPMKTLQTHEFYDNLSIEDHCSIKE
jgi:hypothetical protein